MNTYMRGGWGGGGRDTYDRFSMSFTLQKKYTKYSDNKQVQFFVKMQKEKTQT